MLRRFAGQVEALAVNANGDPSRFAAYGARSSPTPRRTILARSPACSPPWTGRPVGGADPTSRSTAPVDAVHPARSTSPRLTAAGGGGGSPIGLRGDRRPDASRGWLPSVALARRPCAALVWMRAKKIDVGPRAMAARRPLLVEPIDPFFNAQRAGRHRRGGKRARAAQAVKRGYRDSATRTRRLRRSSNRSSAEKGRKRMTTDQEGRRSGDGCGGGRRHEPGGCSRPRR